MDYSNLLHGFVKIVTFIYQSCYMDLSAILLHVFVKFAFCKSKPSWSLKLKSMLEACCCCCWAKVTLFVELCNVWVWFGLQFPKQHFTNGSKNHLFFSLLRQNCVRDNETEVFTQVVDWVKALNQVRLLNAWMGWLCLLQGFWFDKRRWTTITIMTTIIKVTCDQRDPHYRCTHQSCTCTFFPLGDYGDFNH